MIDHPEPTSKGRSSRPRLYLIQPFSLPIGSPYVVGPAADAPRTERLMNYEHLGLGRLLEGCDWELDPGPPTPYGDWMVENREEFALVGAGVLEKVSRACTSGEWDAIVLLGGGEPGVFPSKEIGHRSGVPVISVAAAQMHVATMLGSRFTVLDIAESHSSHYASLVRAHGMADRCASIRIVDYPLPRPGAAACPTIFEERSIAMSDGSSPAVDLAVGQAVAAIEEDGAEVIMFGCSLLFWLQPFVQRGLQQVGWDVPVLEGYSCAFAQARLQVVLGVDVSGLAYPTDRPVGRRTKKFV